MRYGQKMQNAEKLSNIHRNEMGAIFENVIQYSQYIHASTLTVISIIQNSNLKSNYYF